MSKQLTAINIIFAVSDTLICALAIIAFGWGAWFFSKWWILLFSLIPLGLYSNHGVIIETAVRPEPEGDGNE